MKKNIIFGLILVVNLVVVRAEADVHFRSYQADRVDFDLSVNYFKTTANFSKSGSQSQLPYSNSLQSVDFLIQGRYVLFADWALWTGVNINNTDSNDVIANRTNSSVNKFYLGSDFQLYHSQGFSLTGELSYTQALEKVDSLTDSAINSDGANEIIAQAASHINLGWAIPFAKGGINYRTEGLSTLLLYTAGLETRFGDSAFGGLVTGYTSIKDDEKTDQSYLREITTDRVNAFSRKYHAVNPSLLDSEIYLRYKISKEISITGFAGYTLIGTNAANGFHAGGTFSWSFGGHDGAGFQHKDHERSRLQQPRPAPPKKAVPAAPAFSEDTNDGVNQDYFKPVAPSQDEYIEQIEGSPKSLKNATEPEPAEPEIRMIPSKKTSQDSGYNIKLKKIKKKKKKQ